MAQGVNEMFLGFIPILMEASETVLTDYRIFTKSARNEIGSMIQISHARLVSRIGFTAQDMKDFQDEISDAIQNRGLEIGNHNAGCLQEAESDLDTLTVTAGKAINHAAQQWNVMNNQLVEITTFTTVDEVDFLISLFEVELLNLFTYKNGVTSMFDLLATFQIEIQVLFLLFDYFVDYLHADMMTHKRSTNLINAELFQFLNEALQEFIHDGNLIIASLESCHE